MLGVRVPLPLRSLSAQNARFFNKKHGCAHKKMTNPISKIRQFYKETVVELKKASWPTRQELYYSIIVVFVAIGLLGIFVSSADFAIYNVVDLLTWLVKGGK